jgi:centromeric protein E
MSDFASSPYQTPIKSSAPTSTTTTPASSYDGAEILFSPPPLSNSSSTTTTTTTSSSSSATPTTQPVISSQQPWSPNAVHSPSSSTTTTTEEEKEQQQQQPSSLSSSSQQQNHHHQFQVVSPTHSPTAADSTQTSTNTNMTAVASFHTVKKSTSQHIRVAIRLRPFLPHEDTTSIWKIGVDETSINDTFDPFHKEYQFDHICSPTENTTHLYTRMAQPLVLKALLGYHANIFGYGQTSSGKTHTILGSAISPGLLFLALSDIFAYIAQEKEKRQFLLKFYAVEIYNEQIHCLLSVSNHHKVYNHH